MKTDAASGKVKRIRRNTAVQVALCTGSGKIRGQRVPAVAELLPESQIHDIQPLLNRKYRADLVIIRPLRFVQSTLHIGRPRTKPAIPAITPSGPTRTRG